MITHVKAVSGFAADLPALKGRTFTFKPGVNVLFGPNGAGKSTLLRLMAAFTGVKAGGWTRLPDPGDIDYSWRDDALAPTFPDCLKRLAPRECVAEVGWDGSPTFFNGSDTDPPVMTHFLGEDDESGDGMTSMTDQLGAITGKPSQGMLRLSKLNRAFTLIEGKQPALDSIPGHLSKHAAKAAKAFIEYTAGLGRDGPATVLLDEPEKSLSIENQMVFWGYSLVSIGKYRQVIVATHSPLALLMKKDWNFIEVNEDQEGAYTDTSRHLVKWLADKGEPDRASLLVIFDKKKKKYAEQQEAKETKPKKVAKKKGK